VSCAAVFTLYTTPTLSSSYFGASKFPASYFVTFKKKPNSFKKIYKFSVNDVGLITCDDIISITGIKMQ